MTRVLLCIDMILQYCDFVMCVCVAFGVQIMKRELMDGHETSSHLERLDSTEQDTK